MLGNPVGVDAVDDGVLVVAAQLGLQESHRERAGEWRDALTKSGTMSTHGEER